MVALSGPVANSRFSDLLGDFSTVFQPNAVQFAAGNAAARNAGKLALKRDKLSMAHETSQQKRELDAFEKRAKIARPTSRADRFAALFQSGALKSLAEAFKPSANLGADLLNQYGELAKNRPNPFEAAGDALTWTNNYQTLIDGLGPNVLAPYMARGLNEYYDTTVNPFSASLPNPTQGFL